MNRTLIIDILLTVTSYQKAKHGPVGLVHIDAHSDTNDEMGGSKIAHGTPFRRAVEDSLLDCSRVYQIGIRGSSYSAQDLQWPVDQVLKT